jgi:hypothetical protein
MTGRLDMHEYAQPHRRRNARFCHRQGDPSKPEAVDALGLVRPREYSFSLPMPRCISAVGQDSYRAFADRLDGGTHFAA